MLPAAERLKSDERKKRFAPKTRTGCLTCRARRVKCGEEKPLCNRCVRSNRPCHYEADKTKYFHPTGLQRSEDSSDLSQQDDQSTLQSLLPLYGSAEETSYLNKFLCLTAPWLSKYNNASLYYTVLPQRSWHHPALRHSIVAVAMATEEARTPDVAALPSRHHWHYNQALRHVYSASSTDEDTILLTSAMFWLHDNLTHNPPTAMVHLQGFLRLLTERRNRRRSGSYNEVDFATYLRRGLVFSADAADDVSPNALNLDIVSSVRTRLRDPKYTKKFKHMGEVCEELRIGLIAIPSSSRSKQQDRRSRPKPGVDDDVPLSGAELRSYFERWFRAFSGIPTISPAERILLECHYIIAALILQVHQLGSDSDSTISTADDPQSIQRMEYVLSRLEEIDMTSLRQQPATKDVELPVITILSHLICLTSQSHIRVKAFKFLRSLKRVECLWSSDVAADMLWASHPPGGQDAAFMLNTGKSLDLLTQNSQQMLSSLSKWEMVAYSGRDGALVSEGAESLATTEVQGLQMSEKGSSYNSGMRLPQIVPPKTADGTDGSSLSPTLSKQLMRNGVLLTHFLPSKPTWTRHASSEMQYLRDQDKLAQTC